MDGTLTSLQSHCSIQHAALQPAELMLQHGDSKDEALKTFYTYMVKCMGWLTEDQYQLLIT